MCRLTPQQIPAIRPDLIGDKAKKRAAQTKWRRTHREQCLNYDRKRYAEHRSSEIARSLDYQRRNPQKRAAAQSRYGRKKRQASGNAKNAGNL
jgi:hypothetical protein